MVGGQWSFNQSADGGCQAAVVTTSPAGLSYTVTYAGSPTPPTAAGFYPVVATLTNPAYADLSISAIASRWGLPSAPHFSRLFRDAYGCSPREFRRSAADGEVPAGSDALAAPRRSHTR